MTLKKRSGGERDIDIYFEPATRPGTLENGEVRNRAFRGARRTNVFSGMLQILAAGAGHEEAPKAIQMN